MASYKVHGNVSTKAEPEIQQFQFGPWKLTSVKSHILESDGPAREKFEEELELPQVPEMIFAENVLRVKHSSGFGIEFNALDAIKLVDAHSDLLKVAVSQAWKEARADCEHIKEVVKPFDWTYTSDYKGTLIGDDNVQMKVEATDERIDMEKLKVREKIHFYDDILLFEDELSDNGTSVMNVKIRVMPTSFFILLRQYMRVDNVIVRVLDTRVYHEAGKSYMLREHSYRDDRTRDIKAPAHIVTNPTEVAPLLTTRKETFEKLLFPDCDSSQTDMNDAIR